MARYVLVLHADEAAWDDETPEEKAALYAAHGTFMERLAAVGGRVGGVLTDEEREAGLT